MAKLSEIITHYYFSEGKRKGTLSWLQFKYMTWVIANRKERK